MSIRNVQVYVELDGNLYHIGQLWARSIRFNLETAIQDDRVMQDFELESLLMGADHSQKVKAAPIKSDYGSKDCVNLSSSIAVSRFKEGASFQYEKSWLSNKERFALEPALELTDGKYHTEANRNMFGAIGDSAPDRWGRILMRRNASRNDRALNKQPSTLTEIDFLLGVCDEARQGALRFSETVGGPFLQHSDAVSIPPLIELPKLLSASEKVYGNRSL